MSKNGISDKLWRLVKVLYFLFSFLIILFVLIILIGDGFFEESFNMFNRGKLIYYIIYILLGHTTLTAFLGILYKYIRTGDFTININGIKSKKGLYFMGSIIVILFLSHFGSYRTVNFCSREHDMINEYEPGKYRCDCSFGYKKKRAECIKASDEETFSGFNTDQIEWLYDKTSLYTGEEKLKAMEELYKGLIGSVLFKKEYMTGWVEYQTGNIKISHPAQIAINDNVFNEFKIYPNKNIYIQKTNFDQLVGGCIENPWIFQPQTEEEKIKFRNDQNSAKMRYTRALAEIMNGTIKEGPIDKEDGYLGRFDPYSCGQTKGPINLKRITTNGINGVIIDYNTTQDDKLGCITVLFKEVLLIKNMDEIYKITFDYNFGRYGDKIISDNTGIWKLENKGNHYEGELCLRDSLEYNGGSIIERREEYLKTGEGNANSYFKIAVDTVNEMIKTIQIR